MLEHALKYVADGFPVLPLCWPDLKGNCACGRGHTGRAIGKVPLTPNGLKDAALSASKVREYWKRWPQANIGIAIPPGYFVLDVDVEHNGFDSLAILQVKEDFDLPSTWLVTTGSGGNHLWYKTTQPIRNTARLAGYDGLDIRGIGGYCVAPPSLHANGLRYETSPVWPGPIVQAPDKLIKLCLKPVLHQQGVKDTIGHDDHTPYLEGQRNDALTRDAGAMRRRGLSGEAIYAALQVTNEERCQPPLPDEDIKTIARSISRYNPEPEGKPQFRGGI